MAAHMRAAKSGFVLEAKSRYFDLLKSAYVRTCSSSNRNEVSKKNDKHLDTDNLIAKKRKGNVKSKSATARRLQLHEERHAPDSNFQFSQGPVDNFEDILTSRRNEATRSVLVQNAGPTTLQWLQEFGPLDYACFTSRHPTHILAQYKKMEGLHSLLAKGASSFTEQKQFPMKPRYLYFHQRNRINRKSSNKRNSNQLTLDTAQHYPQDRLDFSYPLGKSFDDEVRILHGKKCLRDYDLRIRFFMCSLLEDAMGSVLPEVQVVPYGSCLNGFGWWDGDLDMMMSLDPLTHFQQDDKSLKIEHTPFKFISETFETKRMLAQRALLTVGGIIDVMPRVSSVIKILNARVPIIRFNHYAMNLQCDLSLHAMDGVKMTEILYLLSMTDARLQPLMTTVKQWALHHNVTSSGDQQKPTTLGLLCLLIFYLQTCQPAVLPSLKRLQAFSRSTKNFEIEGVSYRLPVSASSVPVSTNTQSIESLLRGFFEFYASFNFENDSISIIEGSTFSKADASSSPLYMENPLRIGLNICQNVSRKCLGQLQHTMKLSAEAMEGMDRNGANPSVSRLRTLFSHSVNSEEGSSVHRVDLDSLFEEEVVVEGKKKKKTDGGEGGGEVILGKEEFGVEGEEVVVMVEGKKVDGSGEPRDELILGEGDVEEKKGKMKGGVDADGDREGRKDLKKEEVLAVDVADSGYGSIREGSSGSSSSGGVSIKEEEGFNAVR